MIDRDKGYRALLARMRGGVTVHVGVQGEEAQQPHGDSGLTVGDIAAIHELGLGVPRRSFIRDTIDQDEPRIKGLLRRTGEAIFKAVSPRRAGAKLGRDMVAKIQARIDSNIPPPLAASTVQKKGHDLALVETGQLRSSITYVVEVTRA